MANILGISALYHDAAAALVQEGRVVAAAQEERFTRKKHDAGLPRRAARFCLQRAGLEAADLDWVVFYEKPLRRFERILVSQLRHTPFAARAFGRSMFQWLGDRLWIKDRLSQELGVPPERIAFTEHHQAHAASAYFASPWDDAAVLTVDGVGEWATTTFARGTGNRLELVRQVDFPHSLGLFYSAITAFLGFEVNGGESKVMGLAAYGTPRYADALRTLIHPLDDGSYALDLSAFRYAYDPERSFGRRVEELLGPARAPGSPLLYRPDDPRHADIAASLQVVLEERLMALVGALHREVPSENLCVAGGVALNVVANSRMLREGPFARMFVQPAAGDAGGALGAALWMHHVGLSGPRVPARFDPYLGGVVLDDPQPGAEELPNEDALLDRVVDLLSAGRTVGWMQGRFEWGPRALGNRSLLADPRRAEMKDHINASVKHREAFRPFGPSARAEDAAELYALPEGGESPSRFMSIAVDTLAGRELAPAAMHHDGTSRVQVVHQEDNPLYHALISRFRDATGVGVVVNTSLNLKGDPICRTERDGLDAMARSQLDALVVNSRIYVRA